MVLEGILGVNPRRAGVFLPSQAGSRPRLKSFSISATVKRSSSVVWKEMLLKVLLFLCVLVCFLLN